MSHTNLLLLANLAYFLYILLEDVSSLKTKKIDRPQANWVMRGMLLIQLWVVVGTALEYLFLPHLTAEVLLAPMALGFVCLAIKTIVKPFLKSYLGRNYTSYVVANEDSYMVTGGPYRFIRHPLYITHFCGCISIPLILNTWWSFAGILIADSVILWLRIKEEEAALIARFGKRYEDYIRQTNAFVPWKSLFTGGYKPEAMPE